MLDLDDHIACANRVDAAARDENRIPGLHRDGVDFFLHAAFFQSLGKGFGGHTGFETCIDPAFRIAIRKEPHLGFGFAFELWGHRRRGMHLHREALPRIQQLEKEREARRVGIYLTKDFSPLFGPEFVQGPAF